MKSTLHGTKVSLGPATADDVPALAAIRATPEVFRWWRGGLLMDLLAEELPG